MPTQTAAHRRRQARAELHMDEVLSARAVYDATDDTVGDVVGAR